MAPPSETAPVDLADLTLDELRLALAPAIADAAIFDGWSREAVGNAAMAHGVAPRWRESPFPAGPWT